MNKDRLLAASCEDGDLVGGLVDCRKACDQEEGVGGYCHNTCKHMHLTEHVNV